MNFRIPWVFAFYVSRQFLIGVGIALAIVLGVAGLIDLVELIRRTASKEGVPFSIVLEMTFLKMPFMVEQVMPYAVLVGGMIALTRLTRTQELVAARMAGISVWQFMMPPVALSLIIGIFSITIFNPLSSAMISRYDRMEARYISGSTSLLTISSSGLWLRQVESSKLAAFGKQVDSYILHALHISQDDMTFSEVTIFLYNPEGQFVARIDADKAKLEIGYWQLKNVSVAAPGKFPEQIGDFQLHTDLKITQIQDSFAEPRTLSFWELSNFIQTLEKAGFSAIRHKIYLHSLMAGPLLLAGMTLLSGVFSLRLPRRGRIGMTIVAGLVTGFFFNFIINIFHAFGNSGTLPILFSAWAPAFLLLMAGTALLLHLEDG